MLANYQQNTSTVHFNICKEPHKYSDIMCC